MSGRPATARPPVSRFWLLVGALMTILLAIFLLVQATGVSLLTDPTPWLGADPRLAVALTTGLLAADVLLPVPSSIVMYANGRLLGAPLGAAASLCGSTVGFLVAYALGRTGTSAARRVVSGDEWASASCSLRRWGALAIVATRPVPIVAETTALMAGTLRYPLVRGVLASLAGTVPAASVYAAAGAAGGDPARQIWIFLGVLGVSGLLWLLGRRRWRARASIPALSQDKRI